MHDKLKCNIFSNTKLQQSPMTIFPGDKGGNFDLMETQPNKEMQWNIYEQKRCNKITLLIYGWGEARVRLKNSRTAVLSMK